MSNALTNALGLPFGARRDRTQESTSQAGETIPGGREPFDWVEVAVNLAPIEAEIIKGRLESVDIPALVRQESIGAVMGLTVGPLGSASILVPEDLAERAASILSETFDLPIDDLQIDDRQPDEEDGPPANPA